jgi:hypothetical protein
MEMVCSSSRERKKRTKEKSMVEWNEAQRKVCRGTVTDAVLEGFLPLPDHGYTLEPRNRILPSNGSFLVVGDLDDQRRYHFSFA